MKKFLFSLQKLKDYKEQILDRQKNLLSLLRSEKIAMTEELECLEICVYKKNQELNEVYRNGATSLAISVHKRYIVSLQQEIKAKQEQILKKDQEIEKQLSVVIEATKELSTLEKLQEKQFEEYSKKSAKESELFIEEFVQNSTYK